MKKNSSMPINPKKKYGLKKNSYEGFDNEKKIPVAHNFSNGPSLRADNPTHLRVRKYAKLFR